MKLLTGWVVSVGLVFTAVAANAQGVARYEVGDSPYIRASDIDGPYAAMPPEAPLPRYHPAYGPPSLLPATEVYTVLRESGFSPLGIPRRRGLVYTISVIDRAGDDGRLLIDARTGRIIRFIRASRIGDNFDDDLTTIYGPARPLPPPASAMRGPTRPPAAAPRVATRTPAVPIPRASPQHAATPKPLAAKPLSAPAPAQQSAVVQAAPADASALPQAAAPAVAAPPQAAIAPEPQPTQEMPKVQGLE
jgi:hypothetical protein